MCIMLQVRGFRGHRFDTDIVGSLDNIVTPPYDVITPEERSILAAKSPFNMTHAILPQPEGDLSQYQNAGRIFEEWIAQQALRQDPQDSFYLLEQVFVGLEGLERVRRGFFALTKLPESGETFVLGHERTFDKPFEDRLRVTEATQANLGAVFVLYADPDGDLTPFLNQMDARDPDAVAHTFDGVTQRLWQVPHHDEITAFFEDKKLYIADGHHRFRTACVYRDMMRQKEHPDGLRPYDFVLMGFVPFDDPGLAIYPPHRVMAFPENFDADRFLENLKQWFEVVPTEGDVAEQVKHDEASCAIGLAIHGRGRFILRLRDDVRREDLLGAERGPAWRQLDVAVLHAGIIEHLLGVQEQVQLTYDRDAARVLSSVESGEKGLAFLLRAIRPDQVRDCAEACEPMPQKSTYFFPKLPTGMVINRLV
jgi:uncharacterized protein (DUF1015 family)